MRVVCISDTHSKVSNLLLPEGDVLVHGGDFSSMGWDHELKNFNTWLNRQEFQHTVFIPGNHDRMCEWEPDKARELLGKGNNMHYLVDQEVVIEGVKFYGSPFTPWFCDWSFNLPRYDDGTAARAKWAEIPDDTDVLITHGPPRGYGDKLDHRGSEPGAHVGCPYLLERIKEVKPRYHVFGHIHESRSLEQEKWEDGSVTTFINASCLDSRYQPYLDEPFWFDI